MTIKDIAKEAGYAVGTVSRVLNNHPDVSETARARIMEVVERYNFHINSNAKHLKQQTNTAIAIIVKGARHMLFARLVETLQGLIKDTGYACLVYYLDEDGNEVEQALRVCLERQPKGIIFLGSNYDYFRGQFEQVSIPCVMATSSARNLGYDNLSSICIDDEEAARTVIRYLIGLGHQKIGILGGRLETDNVTLARYRGCQKAFAEQNYCFDAPKQYEVARFAMDSGYRAMNRLLGKMPDVTAVFAMSDVMAIGAVRALKDHGLSVPEDVSVIGYDGIEMGEYMVPKLTTIKQPDEAIARRSVEVLLLCIAGQPAVHEKIPFSLMTGESVRALEVK